MRILDRYLVRQFVLPCLWCLLVFITMTVIVDLFEHLDEIVNNHVPWRMCAQYYASFIPIIYVKTSPMAMLLATTFVLGNLTRHQEIVAMKASGISLAHIVSPLVALGLLASVGVFTANEYVVPQATRVYERLHQLAFDRPKAGDQQQLRQNVTLLGHQNRLFHAQSFDPINCTLFELTVLEHDSHSALTGKIAAKRAQWDGQHWVLTDGQVQRLGAQGQMLEDPTPFTIRVVDLEERPEDFLQPEARADTMRFTELSAYMREIAQSGGSTLTRLQVEWHSKLAFPFINLVIVLLGVPFALRAPRRGGTLTGIGIGIMLGLVYYGAMATSAALGKGGLLPPVVAAWLPNVFFGLLSVVLISEAD